MDKKKTPFTVGIDLGGTKILTAVIDACDNVIASHQITTPASGGPEAIIASMLDTIKTISRQAGITAGEIDAVGIAAAGLADSKTGILYASPHLPGWHNVPLRDRLQEQLGIKTFLLNDAKAAALGECHFGAGKGVDFFIYITISTGIGGGIFIDGKLYAGSTGLAGEIGHMTIDDKGPRCHCGNTGCWEMLASGTALARDAKQLIREGVKTSILDYAGGDVEKVTAQVVQTAAVNGDRAASELIARISYYIGVGLANLINIFNPRLIIIGGGLSNMGDMLLKPAFEVAGKRAFRESYQAAGFTISRLGGNSGVLGAVAFAREQLEKEGK